MLNLKLNSTLHQKLAMARLQDIMNMTVREPLFAGFSRAPSIGRAGVALIFRTAHTTQPRALLLAEKCASSSDSQSKSNMSLEAYLTSVETSNQFFTRKLAPHQEPSQSDFEHSFAYTFHSFAQSLAFAETVAPRLSIKQLHPLFLHMKQDCGTHPIWEKHRTRLETVFGNID